MNKYTIKITGNNPEYPAPDRLKGGVDSDGFLLLSFCGEELKSIAIHDVSIAQLAHALCEKEDVINILMQAMAIADGYREADRIAKAWKDEKRKAQYVRRLLNEEK